MRFGQRVFLRPVEKSAGYWYKSLLQHQASTRTLIMTLPQSRRLEFSEIPILDVGPLVAGDDDPTLINALHQACADVGFLYVRNHGVSMALVEALKESAAMFFAAPMVEKMKIAIDPRIQGYLPLGYRSYEGEDQAGTSHQEGFWIGHDRPLSNDALLDGPVQWPDGQPDLKGRDYRDYRRGPTRHATALRRRRATGRDVRDRPGSVDASGRRFGCDV